MDSRFSSSCQWSNIEVTRWLCSNGRLNTRGITLLLLGASLLWSYWPVFATIAERWAHEPQYSHGFFVPLFALFLLWDRRHHCPESFQGTPWGALLAGAGVALYLSGTLFHFAWFSAASLLLTLLGCALLLGGVGALRWSWPSICFLFFMLPLPFSVEVSLAHPLQGLATEASTFILVLLGFPATAEGNIITIGDSEIRVAQACGGLSMCLTFVALAVGCALVIRRPLLDRMLVILSAIPIALIANIVRVTITGVLYEKVGGDAARHFYHDFAGWFMMALALGMVWLLLKILGRLLVEPEATQPLPVHAR